MAQRSFRLRSDIDKLRRKYYPAIQQIQSAVARGADLIGTVLGGIRTPEQVLGLANSIFGAAAAIPVVGTLYAAIGTAITKMVDWLMEAFPLVVSDSRAVAMNIFLCSMGRPGETESYRGVGGTDPGGQYLVDAAMKAYSDGWILLTHELPGDIGAEPPLGPLRMHLWCESMTSDWRDVFNDREHYPWVIKWAEMRALSVAMNRRRVSLEAMDGPLPIVKSRPSGMNEVERAAERAASMSLAEVRSLSTSTNARWNTAIPTREDWLARANAWFPDAIQRWNNLFWLNQSPSVTPYGDRRVYLANSPVWTKDAVLIPKSRWCSSGGSCANYELWGVTIDRLKKADPILFQEFVLGCLETNEMAWPRDCGARTILQNTFWYATHPNVGAAGAEMLVVLRALTRLKEVMAAMTARDMVARRGPGPTPQAAIGSLAFAAAIAAAIAEG